MTNRKNTKRALFASVISMLLCVTMLVGSTFAWFTDNASTAVSNIVSGTLDIELLDGNTENANSLEGKTLTFAKAADAPTGEKVLFEPGAKYSLQQVWLHNAGNLHAKYQVTITGIDGSSKLAEVLDVYVAGENKGTLASLVANGGVINSSTIAPDAYYSFGTIELMMQTTAGNAYQNLTMDGIAITVQATQAPKEYDSHNNTYDDGAEYDTPVANAEAFTEAMNDSNVKNVVLTSDLTFDWGRGSGDDSGALIMSGKTINGSGNETITFAGYGSGNPIKNVTMNNVKVKDTTVGDTEGWECRYLELEGGTYTNVVFEDGVMADGNITFIGCTFNGTADEYGVWVNSGNATFVNCKFNGVRGLKTHEAYGSEVASILVDNCTFTITSKPGVVIDTLNANTTITIQNSTFTNCAAGNQSKYIYETNTDVSTFNFVLKNNTETH